MRRAAASVRRPLWVYGYASVVCAAWTVAMATHYNYTATVVAYVLALPAGALVPAALLVLFTAVGFDPTTSAPLWQNVVTRVILLIAMASAALLNALVFRRVAGAIWNRCRPRS